MKTTLVKKEGVIQRHSEAKIGASMAPPTYGLSFIDAKPVQKKANNTGLPDQLKSGVESLSGIDMSDVKVHYNSSQPAQLNAHAYAQGNQIHIAPGQEKHLPHEAWHVVQQKQGRVKPTKQFKDKVNINDDVGLEKEADVMGAKTMQRKAENPIKKTILQGVDTRTVQRMILPVYNNELEHQQFLDQAEKQKKYFGHGKVIDIANWFFDKNLSGIGLNEDLHIIGHGTNNTVAGMSPQQLATVIVTNLGLPAQYAGRIFLETCNSAANPPLGIVGSYAKRFAQQLQQLRPLNSIIDVVGFAGTFMLEDALGRTALHTNLPIDPRLHPTMRVSRPGVQGLVQETNAILQNEHQNITQEAQTQQGIQYTGNNQNPMVEMLLRTNRGLAQNHQKIGGELTKRYISQNPAGGPAQIVETGDKDVRSRSRMTDEEFRDYEWARAHPRSAKALKILHGLAAFASGATGGNLDHLDPKYWRHVV